MQRTVLELVQAILVETGSDPVNHISDTVEASDIAMIMNQVYNEIVDRYDLPSTGTVQALDGLADPNRPNFMQLKDTSYNIQWIKYDNRVSSGANKAYVPITYKSPEEFVAMVTSGPSTDSTNYQIVFWNSNVPFIINKKKGPSFWNTFDDKTIIFDSYNSAVDTTLQSSKSMVYVLTRPDFGTNDSDVPNLPQNLENLLYLKTLARVLGTDNVIKPGIQREEMHAEVRTGRNKWRQGRQTYNDNNFGRK